MDANQLERWLAEAKTDKVLAELLRADAPLDPELRKESALLSARYETLQRGKRLGTLSGEEERLELAKVNAALLEVVWRLKKQPVGESSPVSTAKTSGTWVKWTGIAIAVIGVLGGIAEFSGFSLRDFFGKKDAPAGTVAPGSNEGKPQTDPVAGQAAVNTIPPTQAEDQRQSANLPASRPAPATPARTDTTLSITCKSNKGRGNLYFKNGETMRFYVNVSQPCYLRCIYKLADGRLVLLDNDRRLSAAEAGKWLEIGSGFEVAEPFGEEQLFVFAQNAGFEALKTRKDPDGYIFIEEGLPAALQKTRGFKKKQRYAESELRLKTVL